MKRQKKSRDTNECARDNMMLSYTHILHTHTHILHTHTHTLWYLSRKSVEEEERASCQGVVQEVIYLHRLLFHLRRNLLHRHTLVHTHTHRCISSVYVL